MHPGEHVKENQIHRDDLMLIVICEIIILECYIRLSMSNKIYNIRITCYTQSVNKWLYIIAVTAGLLTYNRNML